MTHDTDAITLGAPRELATNLAKLVVRRDRTFGAMVAPGSDTCATRPATRCSGFPAGAASSSPEGCAAASTCTRGSRRSSATSTTASHPSSSSRSTGRQLRALAADGWEFGLHAPINAKDSLDALAGGKQWLEGRLGVPLYGLRHHYWALDWLAPHTTFRRHVNSGFRYDSSIAWQDVAGFRAGTCHPYRPFDLEREKVLNIYELPACLMDGHVLAESPDRRERGRGPRGRRLAG